jgi:hypothetical protein
MKKSLQFFFSLILVSLTIVIAINPFVLSQDQLTTIPSNLELNKTEYSVIAQTTNRSDNQDNSRNSQSNDNEAPVILDQETLFIIPAIPGYSAQKRAEEASSMLLEIANDFYISVESFEIRNIENIYVITTEDKIILAILQSDAIFAQKSQEELAQEYLDIIKTAISKYRQKRHFKHTVNGIAYTIGLTGILIITLYLLRFISIVIDKLIHKQRERKIKEIKIYDFQLLSSGKVVSLLLGLFRLIYAILTLVILAIYFSQVLSFFPVTKKFGEEVLDDFYQAIGLVWARFIDYLPELFFILIILIITYYIFAFLQIFYFLLLIEEKYLYLDFIKIGLYQLTI